MKCFSGQKVLGFPMSGLPAPQSITCNDDETCMVFKMRMRIEARGMEVQGMRIPGNVCELLLFELRFQLVKLWRID